MSLRQGTDTPIERPEIKGYGNRIWVCGKINKRRQDCKKRRKRWKKEQQEKQPEQEKTWKTKGERSLRIREGEVEMERGRKLEVEKKR